MNLKVEDIQKYDKLVREKYPTAQMKKVADDFLTWTSDYVIVAKVRTVKGKVIFKFEE